MCAMINSTIADTLFGSKFSISSGSFLSASSLGDWGLMRSGVYTKLLRSYYEKTGESKDTSKSTSTDWKSAWEAEKDSETTGKLDSLHTSAADTALSGIKSTAKAMTTAADQVSSMDFEKSTRDELYEGIKKLTDSYNTVLDSASKTDLVSISQSTAWMVNDTKVRESQLNKIGITIGEDNKLSIDKDKFNEAALSDITSVMDGSFSYAARLSQRASGLANLAANQMAYHSGQTLYSSSGVLK